MNNKIKYIFISLGFFFWKNDNRKNRVEFLHWVLENENK